MRQRRARVRTALALGLILGVLGGCAKAPLASTAQDEREAIAASLMQDIRALASDEFAGREPGTAGEALTLDYLAARYAQIGLVSGTNDPANPWRAPIELVRSKPLSSRVELGTAEALEDGQAIAFTGAKRVLVEDAELVFVGLAETPVAKDIVSGKIAVMLGEPGKSPARRAALSQRDPAAIITVVEDSAYIASLDRAFGREQIRPVSAVNLDLRVFVTHAAMANAIGPERWQELRKAAQESGFAPVTLNTGAVVEAVSETTPFTSHNLIGKLAGTRPETGSVLLLSHWDHLGQCGEESAADRICNGAVDNASGVALMLELARRLAASGPHDRDIFVLATSAEEAGLLGAKAFAENPPVPLDSIVAAFNFDTAAVAPAGSAVGFVGEGRTALDPVIFEVMQDMGRDLGNRAFAERFVKRQDGWALLDAGVPAVFLSSAFGSEITLGPYLDRHYHQPSDDLDTIVLGGAVDDLLLHEQLVRRLASATAYSPAPDSPDTGAGTQ